MEQWIWLLAVAVLVIIFLNRRRSLVDPATARQLLQAGALVVDVRTPTEFQSSRLEGAVNIPLDRIEQQDITAPLDDKNRPILLHCLTGARSGTAKAILKKRGYTSVHNLGSLIRAQQLVGSALRKT